MTDSATRPILLALCLLAFGSVADGSEDRRPLLMTGKASLYQRVLTRPGATLAAEAGAASGTPLPPLSQEYVYERRDVGGETWLEVGASSNGKTDGWLREASTLPWKTQMALAFTNPANRDRALLLRDKADVVDLLESSDPGAAAQELRAKALARESEPRVVSLEPDVHIDIEEQFYLLPILDSEVRRVAGRDVRVLEVGSITKSEEDPGPFPAQASSGPDAESALRNFSAAIVFVIDSTISMGPYIDRTREAVRRIYGEVEKAGLLDQVRFGLVAFRSSTKKVPALEYEAKLFADPNEVNDSAAFLEAVADLKPATVSSAKFDEDAYAGLGEVIGVSRPGGTSVEGIRWSSFGGRYLVLITDAGPIDADDPLSSTNLGAKVVRQELDRDGIALAVLHLKTEAGKSNHRRAEERYKQISRHAVAKDPLYYPIDMGSVSEFGNVVERLARDVVGHVEGAARGELFPGSARTAENPETAPTTVPVAKPAQRVNEDLRLVGLAMQLAYLGRVQGTTAPAFFQAWLADHDYANLDVTTSQVRVLLTKNQLNDLAQRVEAILEAGEESQDTSSSVDFYDHVRSAVAKLARDPASLQDLESDRLDASELGEYLAGLPYRSQWMGLDRNDWASKGLSGQELLLDGLRRNLRHYKIFHEDVDRWVPLAEGADDGDHVYPVPLAALP